MIGALAWLSRHGGAVFAVALTLGLLVPPLAAQLRPALSPVVLVLTFLVLLRTDLAASLSELRRPWRVGALMLWVLVASPYADRRHSSRFFTAFIADFPTSASRWCVP